MNEATIALDNSKALTASGPGRLAPNPSDVTVAKAVADEIVEHALALNRVPGLIAIKEWLEKQLPNEPAPKDSNFTVAR